MTLCAPPGAGWAAGTRGQAPLAAGLHRELYGTTDSALVRASWLRTVDPCAVPPDRAIRGAIVGVGYDGGSYGLRGAAAGPLGLRAAALSGAIPMRDDAVIDLGDVPHFPGPALDELLREDALARARGIRFGDPTCDRPVCMLSVHETLVRLAARCGVRVLSLGGDHSIASSAIAGLGRTDLALIHVDSHADLSSGRDGVSLLHSSWIHDVDRRFPFACVAQLAVAGGGAIPGWIAERLTRVDGVKLDRDPVAVAKDVASFARRRGASAAYLSIDIDAIDAREAPSTGLPAEAGVSAASVVYLVRALSGELPIVGADVVEVAPPLSGTRSWRDEPTCVTGARIAAALVGALLVSP